MGLFSEPSACQHDVADRRAVVDSARGRPLVVCLRCGLYEAARWQSAQPDVPPDAKGIVPAHPQPLPAKVIPVAMGDVRTIRAIGDIPPFAGADGQTHILKAGDVALVPAGVATLLVRRGRAVLVDSELKTGAT